ncbi:MAG: STAS domain-containing protein [Actinomycetes bacterium]
MSGDLTLSTTAQDGCAVVSVGGEVDLGTATQLGDYAANALQEAGPSLVLDLTDVAFMDSTGLKVLLACHRRAQLAGGALGLAAPTRAVRRVLTVTGLDATFLVRDTVAQAVEAVASARMADDQPSAVAD